MCVLLRKHVIEDTLDPHIAKIFDTKPVVDRLSKKLWISSTSMVPIATFIRHQTESSTNQNWYSTIFAVGGLIDNVETYKDVEDSSPSRSDSGTDEQLNRKSSKCQSKRRQRKRKGEDVKQLRVRGNCLWTSTSYVRNQNQKRNMDGYISEMATIVEDETTGWTAKSSINNLERSRRRCDRETPSLRPVNDHFGKRWTIGRSNSLMSGPISTMQPQEHCKITKRIQIQLKSQVIDLFEPTSVISFLSAFK